MVVEAYSKILPRALGPHRVTLYTSGTVTIYQDGIPNTIFSYCGSLAPKSMQAQDDMVDVEQGTCNRILTENNYQPSTTLRKGCAWLSTTRIYCRSYREARRQRLQAELNRTMLQIYVKGRHHGTARTHLTALYQQLLRKEKVKKRNNIV